MRFERFEKYEAKEKKEAEELREAKERLEELREDKEEIEEEIEDLERELSRPEDVDRYGQDPEEAKKDEAIRNKRKKRLKRLSVLKDKKRGTEERIKEAEAKIDSEAKAEQEMAKIEQEIFQSHIDTIKEDHQTFSAMINELKEDIKMSEGSDTKELMDLLQILREDFRENIEIINKLNDELVENLTREYSISQSKVKFMEDLVKTEKKGETESGSISFLQRVKGAINFILGKGQGLVDFLNQQKSLVDLEWKEINSILEMIQKLRDRLRLYENQIKKYPDIYDDIEELIQQLEKYEEDLQSVLEEKEPKRKEGDRTYEWVKKALPESQEDKSENRYRQKIEENSSGSKMADRENKAERVDIGGNDEDSSKSRAEKAKAERVDIGD